MLIREAAMPQVITRSEVVEQESVSGLTQIIRALIILFGSVFLAYLFRFIPNHQLSLSLMIIAIAGVLLGAGLTGKAVYQIQKAKSIKTTTVNCPYCDFPMEFLEAPTDSYDCEGCHRKVLYQNGHPVPVKTVTCQSCKTVHKVAVTTTKFICDRCNRGVKLTDDPREVVSERSELLQNYDVLLTDSGRKKTEVAMALESILICNLAEARRQMENLPLTVVRNVPERKADAVRSRLRDLGATAVLRVSEDPNVPRR
jgi:ribosomal protein L7/L12